MSSHKEEKGFRKAKVRTLTTRYEQLETYIDRLYKDKLESVTELTDW